MVIIYDSSLTEPPSSVYCFRDLTLYSEIFLNNENLLLCKKGTRTTYWNWVKRYGAHDFIKQIVTIEENQQGVSIGRNKDIHCESINEVNLSQVITMLKKL